MVIVLLLLGFVGVMVGVVLYQQNLLKTARETDAARTTAPLQLQERARTGVGLDVDPAGRLLLDEIEDVAPDTPPPGGVAKLTAYWIKQAAYHLRQAERAYADGNWKAALESYEQVSRILPNIDRLQENIGLCQLRVQAYEPAERVFKDLVAAGPPSAGLLNNLAVARMGRSDFADAEKDLRRALELDPDYAPARHNLGLMYFRAGNWTRAAEVLSQTYKTSTDNADIVHMYALALMRLNRWDEAAAVLEESSRLPNAAAPIFFRLAEARSHTKDYPGAMKALESGIDLVDKRTALLWLNRREFELLRDRPEFEKILSNLTKSM